MFIRKIMEFTPAKLNTYLFFKLPSAFWCGVRVKDIAVNSCQTTVKHRWINQNPFQSMYFAVQAMAAELATGVLVMKHIQQSGRKISMLVAHNKGSFTKKAKGRIYFDCGDGQLVAEAIQRAVDTAEGQTFWMQSIGKNQQGEPVSVMDFQWTIKVKTT